MKRQKLSVKLKACKQCHAVVPRDVKKCPRCGSTEFGRIEGLVIVFEPDKSVIAKILNFKNPGAYAQRVRD